MKNVEVIGLAADHAGFKLKEYLKTVLKLKGFRIVDFGTFSDVSCDYPDFAHPLAKAVVNKDVNIGFSICGSGNGINMVVNKYPEIRAALCWNTEIAKFAIEHNNANICTLPARFISYEDAKNIVDTFLSSEFEGGRHQIRINKIPIQN